MICMCMTQLLCDLVFVMLWYFILMCVFAIVCVCSYTWKDVLTRIGKQGKKCLPKDIWICSFTLHKTLNYGYYIYLCEFQVWVDCSIVKSEGNSLEIVYKCILCVCPVRAHCHHVHSPPGWGWSTQRPHRLPGERRIKMLRIPPPPERQTGSGLQTNPHQEGT